MARVSRHYYSLIAMAVLSASPALAQLSATLGGNPDGRFIYDPVATAGQVLPPSADVHARLRLAVARGDWPVVSSILRDLPAAEAARVHLRIAESLEQSGAAAVSVPAPADPQSRRPMVGAEGTGNSAGWQLPVGTLLSPRDVMEFINTLPGESVMDNAHAIAAGKLLKKSLASFGMPAGMDEQILKHAAHWNNADDAGRMNAALLLLAANRPDLAVHFFPSQEQVLADKTSPMTRLYLDWAQVEADLPENKRNGSAAGYLDVAFKLILKMLAESPQAEVTPRYVQQVVGISLRAGDLNQLENWLDQLAVAQPNVLSRVMLMIANAPAPGSPGGYSARVLSLQMQRQLVDRLAQKHPDVLENPRIVAALNQMAARWLLEAEFTRMRLMAALSAQPASSSVNPVSTTPPEPVEINVHQLLMLAPQDDWAQRLYASNSARLHRTSVALLMAADRPDDALVELAAVAREFPDSQDDVLGDALSLWAKLHEGLRINQPKFTNQPIAQGIPTGRITQERNVAKLLEILGRGQKLYGQPLSAALRPAYLDRLYSQTEVYRRDDISALMGPAEQLDNTACVRLVEAMRSNMANVVRAYETQKNTYKNRVAGDITQEIIGGYQTLDEILSKRIATQPDYRLAMLLSQIRFSQAGYARGQNINADDFVAMRRRAFDAIHQAAALYAESLGTTGETAESNDVFAQWFVMALGAAEISQISGTDDFSAEELQRLTQMIHSFAPAVADRHLSQFASAMIGQLVVLKAETKPWILRQAQTVLGEHPMSRPLAAIVQSYDDILHEIKLDVSIDGPADIGSGQPFGLLISFHHTARLARETGGFQRYFSTISRASMLPTSQRSFIPREEVEKKLHAALSDRFEIVSFVQAPNETTPYDLPREGWQSTPLAYAVVKAREPSVDHIPAFQVDMDFSDRTGSVVLQVGSAAVPVDAHHYAARPLASLQMEQTLNDSELNQGSITLLIRATGQGLIPKLDELTDLSSLADFDIVKTEDGGLKVDKLQPKIDGAPDIQPTAQTLREWKLTLQPRANVRGTVHFKFPSLQPAYASMPNVQMKYRRYADTDMEEVSQNIALQGSTYSSGHLVWPWVAGGGALAFGVAGVYLLMRRKRANMSLDPSRISTAPPTPFGSLHALRQIMMEYGSCIPSEDRLRLSRDIRQIEQAYFSPAAAQHDSMHVDASALMREWSAFAAHYREALQKSMN